MRNNSKNKEKVTEKDGSNTTLTKRYTASPGDVGSYHIRIALIWFLGVMMFSGLFVFTIWLFS